MAISNFPQQGGGGIPDWNYVASVRMETFNRSWTQGGAAGMYVLISSNKNNGYAYFVSGGVSTGVPLGNIVNITSPFTRIDIIAPQDDYVSLYKVAAKSTTVFNNPFANFASFPSIITSSGNFVLPNNALPLIDVMLVGGGGGSHGHSSGGGGGGIVKLTAYQAVGTTAVTVGAHTNGQGNKGGDTYFGNVYALGGGGGYYNRSQSGNQNGANGAGAGHGPTGEGGSGSGISGGTGTTQTTSTGLGTKGAPVYHGGHNGGSLGPGITPNHGGAGGGGAGGAGGNRNSLSDTVVGGIGHASNFTGTHLMYGTGGGGSHHQSPQVHGQYPSEAYSRSYGAGSNSRHDDYNSGSSGAALVRYYIP